MDYIETKLFFEPLTEENSEILSALLGEIGYESFAENEKGLSAYIQQHSYNEHNLNTTIKNIEPILSKIYFESNIIKDQNWNAEWEKNFPPTYIEDICLIKAPFHNIEQSFPYEIIIEPKMSFGTGHHATTASMVRLMTELDFNEKTVLDMGCGTGVLAIFASLKKASKVLAIDIDSWSYENTIENIERNNCKNIEVKLGDADLLGNDFYDTILANINRNILLNDMPTYKSCMKKGSKLLLSGYYSEDLSLIKDKAQQLDLTYLKHISENNWVAALFQY